MDDVEIPRMGNDTPVGAALTHLHGGWVRVSRGLISKGALEKNDVTVTLRSLIDKSSASYVVSAEPRKLNMLSLVKHDEAWKKSIIVVGSASTMPDTCPTCNTRGHGPPCPLLP